MSKPNMPKEAMIAASAIAHEYSPKPAGPSTREATANMPKEATLPMISEMAKSSAVRDR